MRLKNDVADAVDDSMDPLDMAEMFDRAYATDPGYSTLIDRATDKEISDWQVGTCGSSTQTPR